MIGQHPQLYGLPELQLFGYETLGDWQRGCEQASFRMADGLLRTVAQLWFGGQTNEQVRLAAGWIRRRHHMSSGLVLEILMQRVHPRIIVEKSPGVVYHPAALARLYRMFPNARFIHLLRHPRGFSESVVKAIGAASELGSPPRWLMELTEFSDPEVGLSGVGTDIARDPQNAWYRLHSNIMHFLLDVPSHQTTRLRGEDLLADPDRILREVAKWLSVTQDDSSIEKMKHPEQSPYARFGPPSAYLGNDSYFLKDPALKPGDRPFPSLQGRLSWRGDDRGFVPAVVELARQLGYS
jgi:hypothetical protein